MLGGGGGGLDTRPYPIMFLNFEFTIYFHVSQEYFPEKLNLNTSCYPAFLLISSILSNLTTIW